MSRRWLSTAAVLGAALALARPAPAWEPTTTHAGLTEQAALASQLHKRLTDQLGLPQGLFEPLIVPPADAEALFAVLRGHNPTNGYVPDGRGRLYALGWLVAGAVLADSPLSYAGNHFFDPRTGKGLSNETVRTADERLRRVLLNRTAGQTMTAMSIAAPDWVVSSDNPMNLDGFMAQYEKAVRARTKGERSRHAAGALLAAGAILHALQDMGSPSHVRDDYAAHLQELGNDAFDLGSRFERIASLAFGRLGVPAPDGKVTAPDLRSFFTADDQSGLADRTAARWFSFGTLPRSRRLPRKLTPQTLDRLIAGSLRRPAPRPLPSLDLFAAAKPGGARLVDDQGICVARYRVVKSQLRWFLDDDCMLEQVGVILPRVAAYSTGLLDWLFRGALILSKKESHLVATPRGQDLGAGTVEFFWDDALGVRTSYEKAEVKAAGAKTELARATLPPKNATRVTVLFRGVDRDGRPLVATGTVKYPIHAK